MCACCHPFREWGVIAHRCVRVCGCAAAHHPFCGASGDGRVGFKACGWAAVPFSRKVDAHVRGCGCQGRRLVCGARLEQRQLWQHGWHLARCCDMALVCEVVATRVCAVSLCRGQS